MGRVIAVQLAITATIAMVTWLWIDQAMVLATAYGGFVAVVNTAIMGASLLLARAPAQGRVVLFSGVMARFAWVLASMAFGMGVLGLDPIALLITFGIAQIAYVAAGHTGAVEGESRSTEPGNS